MGIFDRLRGTKDSPTKTNQATAESVLQAAESAERPAKALRTLRKQCRSFDQELRIGGPLNEPLRQTLARLWAQTESEAPASLPSCERVPWSTWEYPTNGLVASRGMASEAEVLYLADDGRGAACDPVAELEALAIMAREGTVAIVTVGESNLFVRRTLLVEAASALDPEAEDIAQDLEDLARDGGWEARFL